MQDRDWSRRMAPRCFDLETCYVSEVGERFYASAANDCCADWI